MVTMTTIQSPRAFFQIIKKMQPKNTQFQVLPETAILNLEISNFVSE